MKLHFYEQQGNYNLLDSSDYKTQWYVTLKDDENKTVKVGDNQCGLFWEEVGDQREKYTIEDGLDYLADKSFDYACKVWGSTDYKGDTLAFIRMYNEHRSEITTQFEIDRKNKITKEIESLQKELTRTVLTDDEIDIQSVTEREQNKLKSWIASSTEKLSQYKEGTPIYEEEVKRIDKYEADLSKLTPTPITNEDNLK